MAPQPPAEPDASAPVFSPEDEDGYEAYFHAHGFVVLRDVLGSAQVDASVDELWSSLSLLGAYPGIKRDDPGTWGGEDWPAGCRNFLDPLDPLAEVESWRNRVNPLVMRVFEVLWRRLRFDGEGDEAPAGELVVSVDRFGVMRPTRLRHGGGGGAAATVVDRPEWRTSRNWLHVDQNPWASPGFFGLQGLLGLSGGAPTSGGFVTVPGFHREFRDWSLAHPEGSIARCKSTTIPFPIPKDDGAQDRRVKVLVPRGGLLVWDSRMPHENFPNEDESWRLVQYVTCKRLSPEALGHWAAAWHAGIRTGIVPLAFVQRFSAGEQARLGMSATEKDQRSLQQAIDECSSLRPEALEAARKIKRAYRLKQTAMDPASLQEAKELFQAAFSVNPGLREPLQRVAVAEGSYLPFWIL